MWAKFCDYIDLKGEGTNVMNKELEALNTLVQTSIYGNEKNHRGHIFEAERVLKQALKRNEPIKPKYEKDGTRSCPMCHANWLTPNFKYCPDCGQKLDWSDER